MNSARLMTIGEMLDRSISMTVRYFVPMFVIVGACIVPVDIFSRAVFDTSFFDDFVTQMLNAVVGDGVDRDVIVRNMTGDFDLRIFLFFWGAVALALVSFNASFVYAHAVIEGQPVPLLRAYRMTFKMWGAQLLLCVVYTVIQTGVAFTVLQGFAAFSAAMHGKSGAPHDIATLVCVVTGIPLLLAALTFNAVAEVANNLSSLAVAVERRSFKSALLVGLRTVFGRATWRRSLHVASVCSLIVLCTIAADYAVYEFVISYELTRIIRDVIYALMEIVTAIGGTFLFVLFSRDLKTRTGGADLLAAVGDAGPREPWIRRAGDSVAASTNAVGP